MNFTHYLNCLRNYLFDSKYRFILNHNLGLLDWLPDQFYIKYKYKRIFKKSLDLDNPKTYSEKQNWLKLYNRQDIYTTMVDKYLVKEYVANIIDRSYVVPLYGVWDDPQKINFQGLPKKYVLKCNHNSGEGMFINDGKKSFDKDKVIKGVVKGLKKDYYYPSREWPYKNVQKKVFAEKYLENSDGSVIDDYKIMCFNGEPKVIQHHRNRFSEFHTQDFYDIEWRRLPFAENGFNISHDDCSAPNKLAEMLNLTRRLAEGIPFVRIDWYIVEDALYFGEFTFYDTGGFIEMTPSEWNFILGDWINIS